MTNATEVPVLTLHDGVEIPQLGFGVFQIPPEETQETVEEALGVGYRHVDTAAAYRNEAGVGAAIAATGVRREDVFVTTKLWNSEQGYDSTLRAFEQSLERLGTGHVDLYLIHWPLPSTGPLPRHLARLRTDPGGRRRPLDRRLQLPRRGPRAAGAGGRAAADRQPDRAAPAPPAGRAARLARRPRRRHRGLEPARPGRAARRRDDRNRRRPPRPDAGAGDPSLAPADRQRRDPEIGRPRSGFARTSSSSTSSSARTTWRRSSGSTAASGSGRTRGPLAVEGRGRGTPSRHISLWLDVECLEEVPRPLPMTVGWGTG